MSEELDSLIALAADYNPITASLSPDTLAVFGYAYGMLSELHNWIGRDETRDDISYDDWIAIQEMVDTAFREIFTPMIGQIVEGAWASLPPNMLECDGTTYLKSDYPDLYAVLGSAFIVDSTHFQVPDLRGKVGIGVSGSFALGDTGGEETHTLTTAESPSHSHIASGTSVTDAGHTHVEGIAAPSITSISPGVPQPTALPAVGATGIGFANLIVTDPSISSTGGDGAHNNMQPYLVVRKAIIAL